MAAQPSYGHEGLIAGMFSCGRERIKTCYGIEVKCLSIQIAK